jgi:hypothetical protein
MITLQQAIKIRHFKVRIAEAVARLHTASADDLLVLAYALADVEDEFDAFLSSITEEY